MARRGGRVCVLMSGGLDSAVLLGRVLEQSSFVLPLYIRCGLNWEQAELYWLRRFLRAVRAPQLKRLDLVDLPLHSLYGAHWSFTGCEVPSARSRDEAVYLPGRNVVLVTAAAINCAQSRISTIALGILKGNPFGDASPTFLRLLARCLSQALQDPIRVVAPLAHMRKPQLVLAARHMPLDLTFSCLQPHGYTHCGRCNKCAERQRAFVQARVTDPTHYAT